MNSDTLLTPKEMAILLSLVRFIYRRGGMPAYRAMVRILDASLKSILTVESRNN